MDTLTTIAVIVFIVIAIKVIQRIIVAMLDNSEIKSRQAKYRRFEESEE